MVQVSLLLSLSDLQSNVDRVGAAPKRTNRSASPLLPLVTKRRLLAPAGTCRVQNCWLSRAPAMPVAGTPLRSALPLGASLTVTALVTAWLAPPLSVTFKVTL